MTETRAALAQAANETRVAKLAAIAFKDMTPACEVALAFVWAREAEKTRAKIARHNASLGGDAERKRSSGQYTAEEWAAKLEAERQAKRNAILRAVKHYPMTLSEIAAATGYDRKQISAIIRTGDWIKRIGKRGPFTLFGAAQ